MSEQQKRPIETDLVTRVMGLFPNADAVIVSALIAQADALQRYLAQANELTPGETRELLGAFNLDWQMDVHMAATA